MQSLACLHFARKSASSPVPQFKFQNVAARRKIRKRRSHTTLRCDLPTVEKVKIESYSAAMRSKARAATAD